MLNLRMGLVTRHPDLDAYEPLKGRPDCADAQAGLPFSGSHASAQSDQRLSCCVILSLEGTIA